MKISDMAPGTKFTVYEENDLYLKIVKFECWEGTHGCGHCRTFDSVCLDGYYLEEAWPDHQKGIIVELP